MSDLSRIVEQIKNRVSIVDVLQPTVRVQRRGNRLVALCPFHNEKSPSFNVDLVRGSYHCFGCGQHGDHFTFLTEKKGMTFNEALHHLADIAGVEVPEKSTYRSRDADSDQKPAVNQNQRWLDLMEKAAAWYQQKMTQPKAQAIRDYLNDRNVTPAMIERFRIGFAPESDSLKESLIKDGATESDLLTIGLISDKKVDRFRGRLMFPIWDAKGRVIAFGGRALQKDQMPKYLNSADTPLFHKSLVLYGQHLAFASVNKETPPLVVEGYMDTIALHQYGFETAVAPLGTAFSDDHMKRLWQRHPAPVFCFDGDTAGKNAAFRVAQRVCPLLKPHFSVHFCFLPNGEDPDSYLKKYGSVDFKGLLTQTQTLAETLWFGYLEKYHITKAATPEDKTKLKKSLFGHVEEITDPDLKEFFKRDLSDRMYHYFSVFVKRDKPQLGVSAFSQKKSEMLQSLKNIKKNYLPAKILLATLKNNPTLIARVYESLSDIDGLPQDLSSFRDFLCEYTFGDKDDLTQKAMDSGFEAVLMQLDALNLHMLAPFAMPGVDEELALQGWMDIWYQHYVRARMQTETTRMKRDLMGSLDEKTWNQWQHIKTTPTPDRYE